MLPEPYDQLPEKYRPDISPPYAIIGDTHGCTTEYLALRMLLRAEYSDHTPVLVGDLINKGPFSLTMLDFGQGLVEIEGGVVVCGNHEHKLRRVLDGNAKPNQWTDKFQDDFDISCESAVLTKEQRDAQRVYISEFLWSLPEYVVLPGDSSLGDDAIVVSHAGMPEQHIGKTNRKARDAALYGANRSRDIDTYLAWTDDYQGPPQYFGHFYTQREEVVSRGKTYAIDTGCVHGGCLTAIMYPSGEELHVPAGNTYFSYTLPENSQ